MVRKIVVFIIGVITLVALFCIAIQFVPVSETAPTRAVEAGPTPTHTLLEFEGEGGDVIPLSIPRGGGVVISGVQVEPGYFSVWIKDTEGNPLDMVVSCLEACDDTGVTNLAAGEYLLEVESRNRWAVIVSVP